MSRFVEIGKEVLRKEADAILNIMACLDEDFEKAVDIIAQCRGRVVMTGIGKSGLICKKIASTLSSVGVSAIFLHPADSIHGDLGILQNGDVVIVVSNSGETEELIRVLPWIRRMDVTMVVITGAPESTIANYGDIVLSVKVDEVIVAGCIASLKVTAIVWLTGTLMAESAGTAELTVGVVMSEAGLVVKLQKELLPNPFPAISLARVVIVAV